MRIWEDPWLPRELTRKPITSRRNNLLWRVDELIDQDQGIWDEQLVRDIFWPQDGELILKIPVHVDMEDLVAWHYDNRGVLSVRSAYKVQRAHDKRSSTRGVASSSYAGNNFLYGVIPVEETVGLEVPRKNQTSSLEIDQ